MIMWGINDCSWPQGVAFYGKTDFIENLETGNSIRKVQVQGERVGATREGAPHLQVRVGFFRMGVLDLEGSRCWPRERVQDWEGPSKPKREELARSLEAREITCLFLVLRSCLWILSFFFWPRLAACGILVPRPGIEPGPTAVKVWSPNDWPTREFPCLWILDLLSSCPLNSLTPLPSMEGTLSSLSSIL